MASAMLLRGSSAVDDFGTAAAAVSAASEAPHDSAATNAAAAAASGSSSGEINQFGHLANPMSWKPGTAQLCSYVDFVAMLCVIITHRFL
jgi:hypothetical protein